MYAKDFSETDTTRASEIDDVDEGLKSYSLSKAWGAIGNIDKKRECWAEFQDWLLDYRENNDVVHEWDYNLCPED